MTNEMFTAMAKHDSAFVARLIANDEMERALNHARLLVTNLELVLETSGNKPTPVHIHDTTVA